MPALAATGSLTVMSSRRGSRTGRSWRYPAGMSSPTRAVTVGIVGAGLRGRMFADALAGLPDVAVIGFAEAAEPAAASAAAATGLPVLPSHQALLERLDPDAVIVATPDFAHRQAAVDAAHAGKHLLVEKPLATTVADAEAIATAVQASGVHATVAFENRWNPHCVQAKAAASSGGLGDPLTFTATLSNSLYVPLQMLSWAARSSPLWFLLPHTVDLALWLTERAPTSVTAVGSRGFLQSKGIDVWDVVHVLLTLEGGATVNLTSTWVLPEPSPGIVDFRFRLTGTAGSVSADLADQGLTITTDRHRSVWPLAGHIGGQPVGAPVFMAREFAAGLAAGRQVGPGVDHGLLVTRVLAAAERSLATNGQPQPL
jgi:predicted dehydrogenase